ncbi:hypothetical protein CUJ84_Chr000422 [Rhizobium leguminosarum]|uniref:RsdA/BaiN/AoA(So)-like Rossmann fold-like domain-containing protein n=1 Tax=Rhizobium leguminosarum TaxID=384 RepID=A0A2K9YXW6_RHILE|nr:hypothetical protein CUJ84_Chr000422 [Rhizobium leguminosarum]
MMEKEDVILIGETDLQRKSDVIVIGAGAAGMMAAIGAGKRGRSVVVLDHARAPGEKIRISGGGRCNFTNIHAGPKNFLSANPHFCKSALARFTPADFIAMVDRHGIAWHEKTLGQLFCDDSAKDIIRMLLAEMRIVGAVLHLATEISGVEKTESGFRVSTSEGHCEASSLIVADRRHRRQIDPEDGRHRLCLSPRRAVRLGRARNPTRPRAADARSRPAREHRPARRHRRPGRNSPWQDRLPRSAALHPSRAERPGHPADFFLLARG